MWKLVKQIAGSIGVVGTIAAAALWFNSVSVDIKEVNQVVLDSVAAVKEMVEFINIEQGWMASDIQSIKDTLKEFEDEHKAQGANIRSLSWGLKNHETFTPEQFEEVMEELLKKNWSSEQWMPYGLPKWEGTSLSRPILSPQEIVR